MAEKDLPAFIDFILAKTNLESISYIGHSEGTTQMFMAGALMPEYFQPKINVYAALAPVACTANIPSKLIKLAAKYIKEIELYMRYKNYYNWFAPMYVADEAVSVLCSLPYTKLVCKAFSKILHHEGVDNGARFDTMISNLPSGAGYRTFVYYAQQIDSGKCTLYDYGSLKNNQVYGQKDAPPIPFENYTIPTALFQGSLDNLADATDVEWAAQ